MSLSDRGLGPVLLAGTEREDKTHVRVLRVGCVLLGVSVCVVLSVMVSIRDVLYVWGVVDSAFKCSGAFCVREQRFIQFIR